MSAKAYVLIECAAGTIPSILKKIRDIDGVNSCNPVTGVETVLVTAGTGVPTSALLLGRD